MPADQPPACSPLRLLAARHILVGASLAVCAHAPSLAAQTLRGSRDAVDRAYHTAKRRDLPFVRSRREIEQGARDGDYVRLASSRDVRLKGVGTPYVRPVTRTFLGTFAPRFRDACGAPLVVTSAIRPTTVRLANSTAKSVHPTGMALDLRAPGGSCRTWIRRELLAYERRGIVDATEERHPAHFHVVVYRQP